MFGKYYLLISHDYTLTEVLDSIPPGFTFGIANVDYVRSVLVWSCSVQPQETHTPLQRGYYQLDNKVTAAQQSVYYCEKITIH